MSTTTIATSEVQDGSVIASEGPPACPEPCSCEESDALREILQGIVDYDADTNPCDPDHCRGECLFCTGRQLLLDLAEKRKLRGI